VRALLEGRQPIELTPTRLLRLSKDLPHDWASRTTPTVLRSDMESLLMTDFRRLDVVRRIESRVATIDRTPREFDRATRPK
jgi:hypothetical protein